MDTLSKVWFDSEKHKEKRHISWEEYCGLINEICDKIKEKNAKYKYITGIPRGGSVAALLMSYILDVPYMDYANCVFYSILSEDPITVSGGLIVDDLIDSGKTLSGISDSIASSNTDIAILIKKHPCDIDIRYKYCAVTVPRDLWIVFPYETEV